MLVVNFTEARNNFKKICDRAYKDSQEVIINRKNGENVVLISLDEYNSLKETNYLLSSNKNREHLLKSLESARGGKLLDKELIEE